MLDKSEKLRYTAPTDKIFNNLKTKATEIWRTYDDTYGYATEKIESISGLGNFGSNFMFIFQRFDINNQMKLMKLVDFDTLVAVYNRLPDGDYFKQIMNMNFILKKTTHEHNPESLEE